MSKLANNDLSHRIIEIKLILFSCFNTRINLNQFDLTLQSVKKFEVGKTVSPTL